MIKIARQQIKFNGFSIESRESDNFINATQMAKSVGKIFRDFHKTIECKNYCNELQKKLKK